ncbi:sensor domain-containing diguanylate cyclase [Aquicella lusitana]|uniref:Diguanylate cyclase (GGDEF)-like protein n=1 Tax=Aquicella lusitana TaxID=254246 RepID=A0A370GMP8_9COXI|nr:diguanylate cyclase [Aquicella lusitana]RDI44569.1 diguanylate cyclase (GGDEF)-like protein [Aquicella lusitana]VVC72489.1 Cyclic di-GMP phosphodiesterase Gmr [Aquicella lusitana]
MKLHLKVLIILASIWAAIFLIIYVYSMSTLMNGYVKLEQQQLVHDIEQTRKTLNNMLSSLTLLTADWSNWDDAYDFMSNKNSEFIRSNISFTTFQNAKINFILFFLPSGKLFYGQYYDLKEKKFAPLPRELVTYLESFLAQEKHKHNKVGLIKTQSSIVALSALPILTSEGKDPARGILVMGYNFNTNHIEQLSDIISMQVGFIPLPIPQHDLFTQTVYANLKSGEPYYIATRNEDIIAGYTFVNSIENVPLGILAVESPRTLYQEGVKTIHYYLVIVLGIGVLLLLMIWYLLKIFVLDRVINVSQQIINISSESKFSERIKISGRDELGEMVAAVNSLMEIIELTQEQLKYRLFLRTEELERLSNLNKNLYTEMTRQKEIEVKLREGEKILRQMAYYDALTGLPNRLFFNEILQKMIAKSERDGTGIAIMFLDADKLKNINDTYGHDVGDKFLQHTAQQLKNSIKGSDVAARLAGDEFIVCLSNIRGRALINKVAEKILHNISTPLYLDNIPIVSTFSIGISIFPEDGTTIEELEKHADLAMYYAKKQTGSAYCYYIDVANKMIEG